MINSTSFKVKDKNSIEKLTLPLIIQSLQFYWFLGHIIVILNYLLYLIIGKTIFYYGSFIGVIISFSLITYQHFFIHKNSIKNINDLIINDNIQYLLLSIYWFLVPIFPITILPYLMFSIFHSLIYIKTIILKKIFNIGSKDNKFVKLITNFITQYNERCMYYVGVIEILILLISIIRTILLFKCSIITLIIYSLFMKIKYDTNKYTKTAFSEWRVIIDGLISHPNVPLAVRAGYIKLQRILNIIGNYKLVKIDNTTVNTTRQSKSKPYEYS